MKRFLYILMSLILFGLPAFATQPVLTYFQNSSGGLRLIQPDGTTLSGAALSYGIGIPAGTTIVTENGDFVEMELSNGSIIKIDENTNFTILALQGENGAAQSEFEMEVGKFRAVAGKLTGDEQYSFRTRTAVCGIRGTDTGAQSLIDPVTKNFIPTKVFVFAGSVIVTRLDELGKELGQIVLGSGQWADTGAANFAPLAMDPAMHNGFMQGLDFKKLDPNKVPGHTAKAADTTPPVDTTKKPEGEPEKTEEPEWMKTLREILGMEIGTVTIGETTYAKAVLSPTFKAGKFKLSLYLPIIYQTNMFDPNDWYKPDGNNEWSFGTDESFGDNWLGRIGDAVYDLVLKIKGLEIGSQRDDFHLRLGNLNTFTVGHGMIMRNYANDSDFPAFRRVGFNIGLDTGPFGFELVSNDLGMAFKAEPEILGTRLFFRPAHPFPLAIGVSLIADLDPAKNAPNVGDPIFFNAGLDLDFPIVESEGFTLVVFGDFALMLPYFREEVPGPTTIPAGFIWDAIIYGPLMEKSFKNFGVAVGLLGNVSLFEWRLEARYYTGTFKPAFYNAVYDRVKLDYVNEVISYLQNPSSPDNQVTTLGIYGEGVLKIDKIFSITVGYLCPLDFTSTGLAYGADDFFMIKFSLEPRVIPVVGIFGSISYERNKFVSSFAGGFPELFDENTVVRTTIGYPVTEGLSILLHYTTTKLFDPDTGTSSLVHAFTFETVISF